MPPSLKSARGRDSSSQESFPIEPAAKLYKRRFPKTSVERGLGPRPGCDHKRGRAGQEGGLGLFLKTRSQKDHVLVLMSQRHVTRRGDRTPGRQGPPPPPLSHSGRQVGDPGTRAAFQGRGRQLPARLQGHSPALRHRLAGRGQWGRPPFQSPLESTLAPAPSLQAQALPLSGSGLFCPTREVWAGKKKKTSANSELKILSPPNQGRASWPAASEAS